MEGITLTLLIALCIWFGLSNMKMNKQIRDLKNEIYSNDKILSERIESIRKEVNERSGTILDESKAHLDAALIAISKRIGKRKNPMEGEG